MLMEEIILESYHEAIIKTLFYRNNFNFQNWEGLFRDVLEVFEKKIDDIPKTLENYVYHQTKEPIIDILSFLIQNFISENHPGELWKRVFEIKTSYLDTPYDTKLRHSIVVYPKETVLSMMTPVWVWKHYKEVEEFMSESNEFYNQVNKLSGKYVEI